MIKEGIEGSVVLRNYRRDCSRFWNYIQVAPMRDTDGRITLIVGVQCEVCTSALLFSYLLFLPLFLEYCTNLCVFIKVSAPSSYNEEKEGEKDGSTIAYTSLTESYSLQSATSHQKKLGEYSTTATHNTSSSGASSSGFSSSSGGNSGSSGGHTSHDEGGSQQGSSSSGEQQEQEQEQEQSGISSRSGHYSPQSFEGSQCGSSNEGSRDEDIEDIG
jgi:hypothetical protein